MNDRNFQYYHLNSILSGLSNNEVGKKIEGGQIGNGWGFNSIIQIDGKKIFVKKIPLTQKEYDNSYSTYNHYNLPLFYNYGVGSAGFGAFRELLMHIKTTNWVLSGEHKNFPLMYHYRITPNRHQAKYSKPENLPSYIEKWNNSKTLHNYLIERRNPSFEIILFLEFIPFVLHQWLPENSDKIYNFSEKIFTTFNFLTKKKIIHFDAHWGNILADGENPFLTDFGLALDLSFCMNENEKNFFTEHKYYDYFEYIGCISILLVNKYNMLSNEEKNDLKSKYGIHGDQSNTERIKLMIENIDLLEKDKLLNLEDNYIQFLKEHKNLIYESNSFFENLKSNPKKDTPYKKKIVKKILTNNNIIK
ncbi:MAG: hypothetical protein R3B45_10845 [Bdellovibrionota bacterium]